MTPKEERELFATLGRIEGHNEAIAADVAENKLAVIDVRQRLSDLTEAAQFRATTLERTFDKQRGGCAERFKAVEEKVDTHIGSHWRWIGIILAVIGTTVTVLAFVL